MLLAASRDDIRGGITQCDSALFITDIQVISAHSEVADICKGRYNFFRLSFRTFSLVASMSISMFGYLKSRNRNFKKFSSFFLL